MAITFQIIGGSILIGAAVLGDRIELNRVKRAALTIEKEAVAIDHIPIDYNYRKLAEEMRKEKLPNEFIETILTGWWTTCLEVLPAKERIKG